MYVRRANPTAVRVLLVLAILATLCGCGRAAPDPDEPREPPEREAVGRVGDVDTRGGIRAPGRPASFGAPAEGLAHPGASAEEREARVEALCRTLVYTAREGMGEDEGAEFAEEALALSEEELDDDRARPPSVGTARNRALDRLGVPRYAGCESGG